MNLQIGLCMSAEFVKSHGDNVNFSSPEGEGFPPSPKETLKDIVAEYQNKRALGQ
jgi:hypothetical protein